MPNPLAFLAGFGQGIRGVGDQINREVQLDLANRQMQQQADLERERLGQQQRQFDAGRFTEIESVLPFFPADMQAQIRGAGAPRVPNAILGDILKAATLQGERQRQVQEGQQLGAALEGMATRTEMALPPVERAEMEIETPTRVTDPALARLAKIVPLLPANERMDLIKAQFGSGGGNKLISSDKPLYDPASGKWIMPPSSQAAPFTPPQGSRPVPTVNDKGEVSTRYEPEPWQWELARKALADGGWTPETPGYNEALYSAVGALVAVPDGGAAFTRSQALPRPPGRPAPSAPAGGGASAAAPAPVLRGEPKAPSPGERQDLSGLDASIIGVQRLMQSASVPSNQAVLGTPLKNPEGYYNRAKDYIFGTGLTDQQREFLGDTAAQMQQIKRELIGASRTRPELLDLVPMVPDPYQDNAGQFTAKLRALYTEMLGRRTAAENVMTGSRIQPPARPATPQVAPAVPEERKPVLRAARDNAVSTLFPGRRWQDLTNAEKQQVAQRLESGR